MSLYPGPLSMPAAEVFPGAAPPQPSRRLRPRIPHFGSPVERDPATGKMRVVEQDSEESIMTCVNVIARFPIGHLTMQPDFGWSFAEFRNITDDDDQALAEAIRKWEPRAQIT